MTIKFGNFANFIVRNFVVIWEAPNPPKQKEFAQTVYANNFGTVCANRPPLPFKISRKQRKKEFAQTVCANSFYFGGRSFGVGRLPFIIARFSRESCQGS